MRHCDLRVRWKVASDLRFRAAISEPKTPSFCGIPGDLVPSTRKSLAIAIVRFWCAEDLVLLFLVFFENTKENLKNTKDFSRRANLQKPCKTSRKHSKRPRKFPGRKTVRKQKHQGKEGQGKSECDGKFATHSQFTACSHFSTAGSFGWSCAISL